MVATTVASLGGVRLYVPGPMRSIMIAMMSLIALSLGIETAFVATHHVIRIGLIVVVGPLVFARFRPPGNRE